ncbi:integral membrane protein [Rutstroemia sp. NJR-2017a WRK4]|nr:integral membrane protein [Rutstroemia sp. NJR-2017a WRK4]
MTVNIPDLAGDASADVNDSLFSGNVALVFTSVFLGIQVICVALRYISRWLSTAPWGLDDILVVASLLLNVGLAALSIDGVKNAGVGHHYLYLEQNKPDTLVRWLKNQYAMNIIDLLAISSPRLAILVLYRRLFVARTSRIYIHCLMVAVGAYVLILEPIAIFQCWPVSSIWDLENKNPKCINANAFQSWVALPIILTDIGMLAVPIPVIWKLHIPMRLKVGLTFEFLIGGFGLITSILRFSIFIQINDTEDRTFIAPELLVWTLLEPGCYLICACLLMCRPLLELIANSRIIQGLKSCAGIGHVKASSPNNQGPAEDGSVIQMQHQQLQSGIEAQGFQRLGDYDEVNRTRLAIMVQREFGREEEQRGGYVYV